MSSFITVKDAIERLSKFDGDLPLLGFDAESEIPISTIYLEESVVIPHPDVHDYEHFVVLKKAVVVK